MGLNPNFYYQIKFEVSPHSLGTELLLAQLSQTICESFEETTLGLNAYIRSEDWSQFHIGNLELLSDPNFKVSHSLHRIPMENWNAQWEASFQPIVVGDYTIRAPFHPPTQTPYELVIEPKMSFGTGHHQTTRLMLESILDLDVQAQKVLDMGCGTGILAIVAAQRGALHVDALDIEPWCVENTIENASRNHCGDKIIASCGDIENTDSNYDLIMANINRNVLLEHIPHYAKKLRKGGILLLSGFFESDVESIHDLSLKNSLKKVSYNQLDRWMCLKYVSS